jgi:chaperonin GroES
MKKRKAAKSNRPAAARKPQASSVRRSPSRPGTPARPRAAAAPFSEGGRTMPKVRPLRDRVLVKRLEEDEEQKVGGIIVPDTAKEKPTRAEVIAVGSGRHLDTGKVVPLTLKPGDRVLIGKWSGTEVKIDDDEYLILKEDEVLGILG